MLLAGCATSSKQLVVPPERKLSQLPPIPQRIKDCLRQSGVAIPKRKLTAGDVERLWGQDRVKIVAMRLCGDQLTSWYEGLRKRWR